jgi:endoglucanase
MNNKSLLINAAWRAFCGAILVASFVFSAGRSASGEQTAPAGAATAKAIRINAGATAQFTDSDGNVWLPDQGFAGGSTIDRGNIEIIGTKNPAIYRTEHYGMTAFSQPVPNGDYTVKLHFAETFPKATAKGQRVFSVKVADKEIKDLDVVARAGAPRTAWVDTVNVTVTNGKLDITFTPGVQRPEINGIEILLR